MGQKIFVGFVLFLFIFQTQIHSFSYEELLQLARRDLKHMRITEALNFMTSARELRENQSKEYFNLMGEIQFRMENYLEAEEAYLASLKIEPRQEQILKILFQYYLSDRKPNQAYDLVGRILEIDPNSKFHLFRAAVLAHQLNKPDEGKLYLDRLNDDRRFFKEKDPILEEMFDLIALEKWELAIQKSEKFILYFPDSKLLHEYRILAFQGWENTKKYKLSRNTNHTSPNLENKIFFPNQNLDSNYEQALVDASLLFKDDIKFTIRYGNYLQEKGKNFEALQAYRRGLRLAMESQDPFEWKEILYLLGNIYHRLGREADQIAIRALGNLVQKKDWMDNELEQLQRSHPKNIEIAKTSIYHFQKKGDPQRLASIERMVDNLESELANKELIRVTGPYVFEKD